jgi:hypothetical protein
VKTFYSLEDIETLVTQGVRELIVDEDSVLTDVAQDAAQRMGLKLIKGRGPAASAASLPLAAVAPPGPIGGAAKPRGCQHGPLDEYTQANAQPGRERTAAASTGRRSPNGPSAGLVDDLVDAVRKMASGTSSSEGKPSAG